MWYIHTMAYDAVLNGGHLDACHNMSDPWEYYAKWGNAVTERKLQNDSIYKQVSGVVKFIDMSTVVGIMVWGGWKRQLLFNWLFHGLLAMASCHSTSWEAMEIAQGVRFLSPCGRSALRSQLPGLTLVQPRALSELPLTLFVSQVSF